MTLRSRLHRSFTAGTLAGLLAACGGSSNPPTSPTGPGASGAPGGSTQTCRNLATAYTSTITSNSGFTASTTATCSFNATTFSGTCGQTYSDSTGTASALTINAATVYASVADFVDEVSVIPPLTLARSASGTQTNSAGVTTSGSSTFTYDGQRRLQRTNDSSGNVTTFSAWDASGRPTVARDVGPGYDNTRTISYDDAQRSRTTVVNGGIVTTVETFDANGNPLTQVATGGPSVSTTTFTTTATTRVCK